MKKVRILSLDGGGIRGILTASFLVEFESFLQSVSGNNNARIADFFDLVVGTSTGGILSCLLLSPDLEGKAKYSAEDCLDLYASLGKKVFSRSYLDALLSVDGLWDEKYDAKHLESALKEVFENQFMKDLVKPAVVTAYDIQNRKAFFFRSLESENHQELYKVRDALRSTSAAPTYFEPLQFIDNTQEMTLVDGGVFASNPSLCAYSEARGIKFSEVSSTDLDIDYPVAKDMMILSVGTGVDNKSYTFEQSKDWGKAQWMVPLINVLISANAETTDHYLRQIFNTTEEPSSYMRVNIDLEADKSKMDDTDSDYLNYLREKGHEMFKLNQKELESFIKRLL